MSKKSKDPNPPSDSVEFSSKAEEETKDPALDSDFESGVDESSRTKNERYVGEIEIDEASSIGGKFSGRIKLDLQKISSAASQKKYREKKAQQGRKQISLMAPEETHELLKETARFFSGIKSSPDIDVLNKDSLRQLIEMLEERLAMM